MATTVVSDDHGGVHRRHHPSPSLLRLAESQHGAVTLDQAVAGGLSRHSIARLVDEERWTALSSGIWTIGPPTFRGIATAGVLVAGHGALIAGEAAAHLHGLLHKPPAVVDVVVQHHVHRTQPWWRFRRRQRQGSGSPPTVGLVDTVLDYLETATADEAVAILGEVLFRTMARSASLQAALDGRRKHRHRALLGEFLSGDAQGAHSPLEYRCLRDVLRNHGLPLGRRQVAVLDGFVNDVWIKEYGVLIETDGRAHHRGAAVSSDLARDTAAMARGLVTVRLTWFDVVGDGACASARRISDLLRSRGWPGPGAARCPRCRRMSRLPPGPPPSQFLPGTRGTSCNGVA